jgi:hypothetical protein
MSPAAGSSGRKAAPFQDVDEVRSVDGWRGGAIDLSLRADDLELVDLVLCIVPELRVVTSLAQEVRRRGLSYPVVGVDQLIVLFDGEPLEVGGHRVDRESITHALAPEWFPMMHEGELLSAIHLALRRCQAELVVAQLADIRSRQEAGEPLKAVPTEEKPG